MDRPELEYVGFWMRFWAFLIDSILASFLLWPLLRLWGHSDYYYWRSWPWSWSESTFVFTHPDPLAELLNWVLPAIAVAVNPAGSVSVTVTVPLVGAVPTLLAVIV